MRIKEADVVKLTDGREATIIDVTKPGVAYLAEIAAPDVPGKYDDFFVRHEEIEKVIWTAAE